MRWVGTFALLAWCFICLVSALTILFPALTRWQRINVAMWLFSGAGALAWAWRVGV